MQETSIKASGIVSSANSTHLVKEHFGDGLVEELDKAMSELTGSSVEM
jgi:hypothetical protein